MAMERTGGPMERLWLWSGPEVLRSALRAMERTGGPKERLWLWSGPEVLRHYSAAKLAGIACAKYLN